MCNEYVAPVMKDAEPRTEFVTGDLGLTEEAQTKDVHCQSPSRQAKSVLTSTEEPVRSSTRRRSRGRSNSSSGRGSYSGGCGRGSTASSTDGSCSHRWADLVSVAESKYSVETVTVGVSSPRAIPETRATGVVPVAAAAVVVSLRVRRRDETDDDSGQQRKCDQNGQNPFAVSDKRSFHTQYHVASLRTTPTLRYR